MEGKRKRLLGPVSQETASDNCVSAMLADALGVENRILSKAPSMLQPCHVIRARPSFACLEPSLPLAGFHTTISPVTPSKIGSQGETVNVTPINPGESLHQGAVACFDNVVFVFHRHKWPRRPKAIFCFTIPNRSFCHDDERPFRECRRCANQRTVRAWHTSY
jgi:hypothetical protein